VGTFLEMLDPYLYITNTNPQLPRIFILFVPVNQMFKSVHQMFKSVNCPNQSNVQTSQSNVQTSQSNVQINQLRVTINQMFRSIKCSNQSDVQINQVLKSINQSNFQINQSVSTVVQVQVAAASAWLADLLRERKDAGRYCTGLLTVIQQCTVRYFVTCLEKMTFFTFLH
jgi:hypothetical protein